MTIKVWCCFCGPEGSPFSTQSSSLLFGLVSSSPKLVLCLWFSRFSFVLVLFSFFLNLFEFFIHIYWENNIHFNKYLQNTSSCLEEMSENVHIYSDSCLTPINIYLLSVQSLSHVRLFVTPWIAAHQASLSITSFRSLLKLLYIELVMPSSHLILCRPLLLLPPVPPSIRVFSNESTLRMRWPKY